VVLATGTQGGTIGSGIRPPFSLVPRDPGHESGIYGEEVKLEGKVSDEYFEAYVDAHDEGERVEGPTDAVCRIAAFWAVDNLGKARMPCASHWGHGVKDWQDDTVIYNSLQSSVEDSDASGIAEKLSCCAFLCEWNVLGWL
jgi:hypothetical protein